MTDDTAVEEEIVLDESSSEDTRRLRVYDPKGDFLIDIPAGAIKGQADLRLTTKTEAEITTPRTGEMNPTDVPFGAAGAITGPATAAASGSRDGERRCRSACARSPSASRGSS